MTTAAGTAGLAEVREKLHEDCRVISVSEDTLYRVEGNTSIANLRSRGHDKTGSDTEMKTDIKYIKEQVKKTGQCLQ